jgi:hypothetical protein
MTLDDLRRQYPALGFALYALEPGAGVTLEMVAPDGEIWTLKGQTAAEVLLKAGARPGVSEVEPVVTESVFD